MSDSPAGALAALATEYWEQTLAWNPLTATLVGDRRFDDSMPDLAPEALEAQRSDLAALAVRADTIPTDGLSPEERVTRLQLIALAKHGVDERSTGFESWLLDPLEGPQVSLLSLPAWHAVRTRGEADAFLARVEAMGPYLVQHIANLERGHAAGLSSSLDAVKKVAQELTELLAKPSPGWSLVTEPVAALPPAFGDAARRRLQGELEAAVERAVRPGFERLARFVRDVALPRARPADRAGLCALPEGRATYDRTLRIHTSLSQTAQAIHELGLAEVDRINEETRALGERVLGTSELAAIQARLRSDPALHFTSREEVEAKAASALRRAEAEAPRWFGRLPKAPCIVRRIEEHEEKFSTIAYYRSPAADGSRPGTYFINTYAPATRPRYDAEALAFHEAVPGHHMQIAIAQELTGIPEFRKHTGPTAYVEGWALYTERLCDEMGLYSGDLDRFGMLSFDSWRACRLVVDTGLHALGWSRARAIEYMRSNSVLAENNIENEVDRYISWPGQATAYKIGQLEILRLRAASRARLGAAFDLPRFHDAVLGSGAVGLATLAEMLAPEPPPRG
ncbi:MAG: DUF885 domain-containing protein [Candidatus Eisenbacteria bacterium]